MKHGDSKQDHQEKLATKRAELQRKKWSEARINQYLKDWGGFNVRPYGQ